MQMATDIAHRQGPGTCYRESSSNNGGEVRNKKERSAHEGYQQDIAVSDPDSCVYLSHAIPMSGPRQRWSHRSRHSQYLEHRAITREEAV